MKKIILTIATITAFASVSFAQTQAEMNNSASIQYAAADKELNIVYGQLMRKLDASQKAALIEVEKAWLKYRDLHCSFAVHDYQGGSIQPTLYAGCLTEMTNQRIVELKQILKEKN